MLYLAWGVLWRRPGQGGWVLWQVPGVLLFGAITVWALSLEHPQLQYVLAVGWCIALDVTCAGLPASLRPW